MPYQFQSRVRYSEVDENGKLTLPGLINYFQDCSTFQSEELGVGLQMLAERKRAWILASWHIQIARLPQMGENIITQTWPYSFKGFYGERNFCMLDGDGNMLAGAASMWVYMNTETMRPCKVDEEMLARYAIEPPLPLGPVSRKIQAPQDGKEMDSFLVMRGHLDTNHHVNNGQYIRMAQEYLPQGFEARGIRVEYRRAAVLHDTVTPFISASGDDYFVSLCGDDKKPYAVVCFSRKGDETAAKKFEE